MKPYIFCGKNPVHLPRRLGHVLDRGPYPSSAALRWFFFRLWVRWRHRCLPRLEQESFLHFERAAVKRCRLLFLGRVPTMRRRSLTAFGSQRYTHLSCRRSVGWSVSSPRVSSPSRQAECHHPRNRRSRRTTTPNEPVLSLLLRKSGGC